MRALILLTIGLAIALSAAEMTHCRVVLKGGEELTGWWAADQGVLYLDNGKRRLIDSPAEQVERVDHVPAADGVQAPERRQFEPLPDLPYGKLVLADGRVYSGWWDEEEHLLFREEGSQLVVGEGRTFTAGGTPAVDPPKDIRKHLTRKAVERD